MLVIDVHADSDEVVICIPRRVGVDRAVAAALVQLVVRLRSAGTTVTVDCDELTRRQLEQVGEP